MNQPIRAGLRQSGSRLFIDLSGDLTRLPEDLASSLRQLAGDGSLQEVVLQFAAVPYINSAGIAALIALVREVRALGARLAAVGLNDHYRRIFGMVGLTEYITLYGSESDLPGEP